MALIPLSPCRGYFSLNSDAVLSVDEALIPQALMLLHNSAPVLNPAGYYLFLGGAAYPPVAYYIENSRFQGEVLQGGKATSMCTHMHTGDTFTPGWTKVRVLLVPENF